jgi:hypothetical protein
MRKRVNYFFGSGRFLVFFIANLLWGLSGFV